MAKGDIYARLDALAPAAWDGPAFRHTAATLERSRVLNGEGARHHGGRWNPADSFRTVYMSVDVATAVAEFRRSISDERDVSDVATAYALWRVIARVENLVDLRPQENRRALGLAEPFVGNEQIRTSQDIGDAAYYVRYKGMLVPSAAAEGGVNLVVFPDHLEADDLLDFGEEPTPEAMSAYFAP
jgi:RES domain-containing protein